VICFRYLINPSTLFVIQWEPRYHMTDWTLQSSDTPVQLILESWDHYPAREPTSTHGFLCFIAVTRIHRLFPTVPHRPLTSPTVPGRHSQSPVTPHRLLRFTLISAIHSQSSCTPTHYCLRLPGPSSSVVTAVFRFCRQGWGIFRRPVRSRGLGSLFSGPCRAPGRLGTLHRILSPIREDL